MRSRGFAHVAVLAVVTASATRVDAQEHIALPSPRGQFVGTGALNAKAKNAAPPRKANATR